MAEQKSIIHSFYTIRKAIGILGILLPWILLAFEGQMLASISHYYYSESSLFFTAILSAFGLFLISYKGYERDKETEILSDNRITFIGGVAAIIVVLVPTTCEGSESLFIRAQCAAGTTQMFGHCAPWKNMIHLGAAAIFLSIMGFMSIFRFTKGSANKARKRTYRICGYMVWLCIFILLVEFATHCSFGDYDVFIFETIAVSAFGLAWLLKGLAIKDLISIYSFARQNKRAEKLKERLPN
jgi:hypothetical protein